MAPSGTCVNAPPLPETIPEGWNKIAFEIRIAFAKVFANAAVSPDDY